MRIARKLMLLAMLAIAATALAVPSAFAQETEPELHNQTPRLLVAQEVHAANDVACPAVTPSPPPNPSPNVTAGGCRLHFSAPNVALVAHVSAGGMEVPVSTCNVEFDARLDAAGEGWISHQEFTPGTVGTCTQQPCDPVNAEGRAYGIHLQETEPAPREVAHALFCTEPIGGGTNAHCEVTVPLTQPTLHRYQFNAVDVSGHGTFFPHCELTGNFQSEAVLGTTGEGQLEQNVEIRHT